MNRLLFVLLFMVMMWGCDSPTEPEVIVLSDTLWNNPYEGWSGFIDTVIIEDSTIHFLFVSSQRPTIDSMALAPDVNGITYYYYCTPGVEKDCESCTCYTRTVP